MIFFFKQKTAYEMRISDWSSDVCSSDLREARAMKPNERTTMTVNTDRPHVEERGELALMLDGQDMVLRPSYEAIDAFEKATGKGLLMLARDSLKIGRASCREGVCQYV